MIIQPCSQLSSVTSSFSQLPSALPGTGTQLAWAVHTQQLQHTMPALPPKLGQREAPTAAPGGSAFLGTLSQQEQAPGCSTGVRVRTGQGQGQGTLFIRSVGTLRKTTCDCRHIRLLQIWNRSNNLRAKYRLRIVVLC